MHNCTIIILIFFHSESAIEESAIEPILPADGDATLGELLRLDIIIVKYERETLYSIHSHKHMVHHFLQVLYTCNLLEERAQNKKKS